MNKDQIQLRNELVTFFKAMGDTARMQLVRMLASGMVNKVSVNELSERLDISQPAVSQHLKILNSIGILEPKKEGYHVFYYVNIEVLNKYKQKIDNMFDIISTKCGDFPKCNSR